MPEQMSKTKQGTQRDNQSSGVKCKDELQNNQHMIKFSKHVPPTRMFTTHNNINNSSCKQTSVHRILQFTEGYYSSCSTVQTFRFIQQRLQQYELLTLFHTLVSVLSVVHSGKFVPQISPASRWRQKLSKPNSCTL